MERTRLVLVTGATGYVGGRLVPRLLKAGYMVRVFVRDAARVSGRPWAGQVEICHGDILRQETIAAAMDGLSAAYYRAHSMRETSAVQERDIVAARQFANSSPEGDYWGWRTGIFCTRSMAGSSPV